LLDPRNPHAAMVSSSKKYDVFQKELAAQQFGSIRLASFRAVLNSSACIAMILSWRE
jgi:hypothetical protein